MMGYLQYTEMKSIRTQLKMTRGEVRWSSVGRCRTWTCAPARRVSTREWRQTRGPVSVLSGGNRVARVSVSALTPHHRQTQSSDSDK